MEDLIEQAIKVMQEKEGLRGTLYGMLGSMIALPGIISVRYLRKYEHILPQGQVRMIAVGIATMLGVFLGASGLLDLSHSIAVGIQAGSMIVAANGIKKGSST